MIQLYAIAACTSHINSLRQARSTLLDSAFTALNIDRPVLDVHPEGKPYLSSHPQVTLNLSHSGSAVFLAIGRDAGEIGIDAELLKHRPAQRIFAIADRFFSAGEADILHHSTEPLLDFYRIWTRKEALVKYTGTGFRQRIADADVCTAQKQHAIAFTEYQLTINDLPYLITLCTQKDARIADSFLLLHEHLSV